MIKIDFNYDKNYRFDFDEKRLAKRIAKCIFETEKLKENFSFSVSLVSKNRIRLINKRTRNINKITDVLSFPYVERSGLAVHPKGTLSLRSGAHPTVDYDTKTVFLGDIVICYDLIISQAKAYGHSVKREYSFLLTHSLLHLLGYDHIKKKDEKMMFEKQELILSNLNINR